MFELFNSIILTRYSVFLMQYLMQALVWDLKDLFSLQQEWTI